MKYKFIVVKIDKFNNFVPKILILAKFGKVFFVFRTKLKSMADQKWSETGLWETLLQVDPER
jgi:hypothetical protein